MRTRLLKYAWLLVVIVAVAETRAGNASPTAPLYKVAYSTFLGGSGMDSADAVAVDAQGNVFVTGSTQSKNFPTTNNASQKSLLGFDSAFITKLDSTGKILYSSYLNGCRTKAIALDNAGNVYIAGHAYSRDFLTTPRAFQRDYKGPSAAFVMKLNSSTGAIIYSTLLGGSGDEDWILHMSVDRDGNGFVAGYTKSPDFPITDAAFQRSYAGKNDSHHITCHAFVAKLNATASALVFSTYLEGSNYEEARGIAIDSAGNSYVTGYTKSSDFPTTHNAFQAKFVGAMEAFVTKLNASGSRIVYSTFLGGFDDYFNSGDGIAIDRFGSAYVTGNSQSPSFPTTSKTFQPKFAGDRSNAFISRLNPDGTALEYSTFLGGRRDNVGAAITLDAEGKAYVTGYTNSRGFPTTADAYQKTYEGGLKRSNLAELFEFTDDLPMDAFLSVVSPAGDTLVYSTFLGGWEQDLGSDIAIDAAGNVYLVGFAGSTKFPTTKGAFQTRAGGSGDAFIAKLSRNK